MPGTRLSDHAGSKSVRRQRPERSQVMYTISLFFILSHCLFLSLSCSDSSSDRTAVTAAVCSRNSYHTNMTSVLGKLALVVGSAFRHGDEGFKMPEEHLRVFGNECRHTTQMNAHTTQKQTNVDIQIRISMQHAHHTRSKQNLTICVFVCVFVCARFWLQRGGGWQGSVENGNVHLHVPCKCMYIICVYVYACLSPALCRAHKISHVLSLANIRPRGCPQRSGFRFLAMQTPERGHM